MLVFISCLQPVSLKLQPGLSFTPKPVKGTLKWCQKQIWKERASSVNKCLFIVTIPPCGLQASPPGRLVCPGLYSQGSTSDWRTSTSSMTQILMAHSRWNQPKVCGRVRGKAKTQSSYFRPLALIVFHIFHKVQSWYQHSTRDFRCTRTIVAIKYMFLHHYLTNYALVCPGPV